MARTDRANMEPKMTTNEKAFLDMIATSEGTAGKGDDGYNVLVGGALFEHGYAAHPDISVYLSGLKIYSTAAGRYQFIHKTWVNLANKLGLQDFSPASQDAAAIELIRECGALDDVDAGNFESAVKKCAHIWASLPGAGYGQHENKLSQLQDIYTNAGGTLA